MRSRFVKIDKRVDVLRRAEGHDLDDSDVIRHSWEKRLVAAVRLGDLAHLDSSHAAVRVDLRVGDGVFRDGRQSDLLLGVARQIHGGLARFRQRRHCARVVEVDLGEGAREHVRGNDGEAHEADEQPDAPVARVGNENAKAEQVEDEGSDEDKVSPLEHCHSPFRLLVDLVAEGDNEEGNGDYVKYASEGDEEADDPRPDTERMSVYAVLPEALTALQARLPDTRVVMLLLFIDILEPVVCRSGNGVEQSEQH